MTDSIVKLQACFEELFGDSYIENCLIEIDDNRSEIILSANREGMLFLIEELIKLCKHNEGWSHYHLDEAGMASRCNKPMVISLVKEDGKVLESKK